MFSVLVTGGAGFIGSNLIKSLLEDGNYQVTCIDNIDDYYDKKFKLNNLESLRHSAFKLIETDITDLIQLKKLLTGSYDAIVHLAARPGVRPSIVNPFASLHNNLTGTLNMLDFAKERQIKQFVFASSSSVYGQNNNMPWSEDDTFLKPISPYASSKAAAESLGYTYSHIYGIRFLALRFFTVYGPGQRPDLAIHKFSRMLLNDEPITVYGDGSTRRDYTYIEDIIQGIKAAIHYKSSNYEIVNLGNHQSIALIELIQALENTFSKKATLTYLPEQVGDLPATYANIEKASRLFNYHPHWNLEKGLIQFKNWFETVYQAVEN